MMLGNNDGTENRQLPEIDRPAPLLSWIFYILSVLSLVGAAIYLGSGEGAFAFGGLVGAILWFAIGRYLHNQSDRQAEMVELMREQQRRR